jgi:diadenosine tetraphosphate (Ap4A) HIT family hydrolase
VSNCEICPIIQSDEDETIVINGQYWRVALNPNQEYLAKCFVTLRTHTEKLSDLSDNEWHELSSINRQLESAIGKALSPTHFNWSCLMNDAVGQGRPAHVHWHCQPRYKEPIEFAGEIFVDSCWPQSARKVHEHFVSQDVLNQIAKIIQDHI